MHFHSTVFNCSVPQEHFINEGCYGEDVCRWLIRCLGAHGYQTAADPGQEDFGWYFTFQAGGSGHCFVVSFLPNDPAHDDQWLGWVERQGGFFGSLFGARQRGVHPAAVQAIDEALESSPDIRRVTGHESAPCRYSPTEGSQ